MIKFLLIFLAICVFGIIFEYYLIPKKEKLYIEKNRKLYEELKKKGKKHWIGQRVVCYRCGFVFVIEDTMHIEKVLLEDDWGNEKFYFATKCPDCEQISKFVLAYD